MHLFFDLDGTLTDPREGIVACIAHAMTALGRPVASVDGFERFIGPPLDGTFAVLLETDDRALIDRAIGHYRERFSAVGLYENVVLPGIPALLAALRADRHRLRVVTSKPEKFAEIIIDHFGLRGHFEAVHGATLDGRRHDKAELIAHVLTSQGIAAAQAVMIGDREHDVRGARCNDVHAIAVTWGYGTDAELEAAGPDAIVRSAGDLHDHLRAVAVR